MYKESHDSVISQYGAPQRHAKTKYILCAQNMSLSGLRKFTCQKVHNNLFYKKKKNIA